MTADIELEPLMQLNKPLKYVDDSKDDDTHSSLTESLVSNESTERPHETKTKRKIVIVLIISLMLGLVSGTLYGFGRYSRDLKDTLNLTQYQIERFGILLDTGNYIGHPITGLVYDRFGPRVSCISAAVIVFCAYAMIEIGVVHHFTMHWIFGLSFFFVGFGSGLGYIAALGSTTKSFQSTHHFSLAVGIVASGYGLSSTIVGFSYHAIGLRHFFFLWAFLVSIVNILGSCLLTVPNKQEQNVINDEINQDESSHSEEDEEVAISDNHETIETQSRKWEDWRTKDFWILFFAFACCTGSGLFVINNVSTMVQSIHGRDSFAASLVILLSLSNCSGRILMGFLADIPYISKFALLGLTSLVMAAALFLSASAQPHSAHICLTVTVLLVGVSYGGTWVLIVGILTNWFGSYNFGKNYGLIVMGPALSGMLFNTASARAYEQHTPADSEICVGTDCYGGSFLLTGFAAAVCCIIASWLECSRH